MGTVSSLAPAVFEAAVIVARQRAALLAELRRALEQNHEREALKLARSLTGLEPQK